MADAATATNNKTPGYERWPEQKRRRLVTEEYEYEFPFHYANVTVNRRFYRGSEFHGVEMNVVNSPNGVEGYTPHGRRFHRRRGDPSDRPHRRDRQRLHAAGLRADRVRRAAGVAAAARA